MKRLALSIVLALFIQSTVSSQSCLPDGIWFRYQAQIDNFQANYPNCTQIEGHVTIGDYYSNITNLNGLSILTSIGGDLKIGGKSSLTSLTGLDNVTSIGGDLRIKNNDALTNLTGLDNVISIGGSLNIGGNTALTSLTGLGNLTSIEGNLIIGLYEQSTYWGNASLTSLTGLDNVTTIGGNLTINGGWGGGHTALTSLTGLDNVTAIGGDLSIYGNDALTSLTGLDNIDAASIDNLFIYLNSSLSICEAQSICNYLVSPNGIVGIYSNATGCNNPPEIANTCGITLPCLPFGNYYLYTQSQIDNFPTNYPNCTIIEGDIEIGHFGGSDITNLNGLNVVTSIMGDLHIRYNDALISLTGLDNVTSIGGDLTFYENIALTSLTGLDNVISIGGDLMIGFYSTWGGGNLQLTSLTGLDNVTSIGGNLLIENCGGMTNMTGLESLTTIGGDLGIGPTRYAAPALVAGGGRNAALTSMTGLESLTSIGGDLRINDNDALTSLTGLDNLASIGGAINLFYNDSLTSLTSLHNVTSIVEDLMIYGNYSLPNLTGLDNVTSIGGDLWVGQGYQYGFNGNANLTSLTGLDNLTSIGGDFIVGSNDTLTSLAGLGNLTTIEGNLSIGFYDDIHFESNYYGNAALTNLTGLDNVTSIGGSLLIYTNDTLTNLSGLDNLTSIGGDLSINANAALTSLTGLGSLTSIDSNLSLGFVDYYGISGNPSLTSLTGLDNLTSIMGDLHIRYNDALISLTGLDNISANSITDLYITNNNSLSSCEVQSLCDYLSNPNGSVHIYNNASGCNNPAEVASACGFDLPCLPFGDYYFTTQTEIDNFATNYPNCTELAGGVTISGLDIINLNGLIVVTSIGGNLSISNNDALISLTGLDSIDANSIADLAIRNNDLLSTCGVESVCDYLADPNGSISIHYNASGCDNSQEVEEACESQCLPEGVTLDTQDEVDDFRFNYPGCHDIQGNLTISGAGISNLNGLHVLGSIGGDLIIESNDALISLSGMDYVSSIGGNFLIQDNDSLASLSGLDNLTSIGGGLTIAGNASITNLWGLENIYPGSIIDLHIVYNSSLSECAIQNICEYLANPGGTIQIFNNGPGCFDLEEVEEACAIQCIYEGISFSTQEEIDDFQTNFPNCTQVEGDVMIGGSDITNLNGLNNLTYIGGDLAIGFYGPGGVNLSLNSLSGLINLTYIGGDLSIELNPVLNDLYGLDNLSSIDGELKIKLNESLVDIEALRNVNPGSITNLLIYFNYSLSECDVESICDYLESPNGSISIHHNAPGCNSQDEVVLACTAVTVEEMNASVNYSIYPNPAQDMVTFSSKEIISIELYNMMGALITRRMSNTIDMSNLNPGIYFVIGFDKNKYPLYKGKIIKK